MINFAYGIDFGEEISTLAILDIDKKKVVTTFSIKSCLYIVSESEIYTGSEAEIQFKKNKHAGLFIHSPKALLYHGNYSLLKDINLRTEYLLSYIFKSLKVQADSYLNLSVNEVSIGRPIYFSNNPETDKEAENILVRAGFESGFNLVHIQYEVAALGYAIEYQLLQPTTLLIADIETFKADWGILQLSPEYSQRTNRLNNIILKSGLITQPVLDSALEYNHTSTDRYINSNNPVLFICASSFNNKATEEKLNLINSLAPLNQQQLTGFADQIAQEVSPKTQPELYYVNGSNIVNKRLEGMVNPAAIKSNKAEDKAIGLALSHFYY